MLELHDLHAYYGKSHVLQGVDFTVAEGQIVSLLGRNGSGRSTVARAIMGLVDARGSVLWRAQQLLGLRPFEIARRGVGYVPESRDVFPALTVRQNLMLGMKSARRAGRWSIADMYALFPALRARENTRAGVLSGGEQQMLAMCRTLLGDPELIIVDEPTEGLAPSVVAEVGQFLRALRERGVAILLIEQKLAIALQISDRVLVMGQGKIAFDGSAQALRADEQVWRQWLGV